MADMVMGIAGKQLQKRYLLDKSQDVLGRSADNAHIPDVFGWDPSTSLREGLSQTYPWIPG